MNNECTYLGTRLQPCGSATLAGKSYCAEHYALVYQVGTARARRKKDIRVANTVWDIENAFNEAVEELEQEGYDLAAERWDAEIED